MVQRCGDFNPKHVDKIRREESHLQGRVSSIHIKALNELVLRGEE